MKTISDILTGMLDKGPRPVWCSMSCVCQSCLAADCRNIPGYVPRGLPMFRGRR